MLIGFIIVLAVSVLLGIKLSFKISGAKDRNILFSGFIVLLFICLNLLIFVFSQALWQEHIKVLSYSSTYEAIVVGEKGSLTKSSFKNSHSEHPIYAAIVEFKDKDGNLVRIETNEYSSERPIMGSKKMVAYSGKKNNTYASDLSFTSTILLFLGGILITLLVIVSFLMGCYAYGIDKQHRKRWAKIIFMILIFFNVCIIAGRIVIIIK